MLGKTEIHRREAPWPMFARHLDRGRGPFFLDRGCEGLSFAGSSPSSRLVVLADGSSRLWRGGRWKRKDAHPLEAIEEFVSASEATASGYPSWSPTGVPLPRTVGYLSYELGTFIESVPAAAAADPALPLALLSTYDRADAWNPWEGRGFTVEFEKSIHSLNRSPAIDDWGGQPHPLQRPFHSREQAEQTYHRGFERIREAISAGDIYQANLSRRIVAPLAENPSAVYQRMRCLQPVPQGAYLEAGDLSILSNSPECFLRVEEGRIATFPIKGTRARRRGRRADARAKLELKKDPKELAEHLMIVDLERNDLGRVCETASVAVPEFARVKSFSSVHHLVSEVRGRLAAKRGLADVLRASFPGGSITGAPKIRAMEIIAEVEPHARGIYTGAIGCFNGPASYELNIAIRTAVAARGLIHYSTGGGIVADSTARSEWEETEVKARAFLAALQRPALSGRSATR